MSPPLAPAELIRDRPLLHVDGSGTAVTQSLPDGVLRYLSSLVRRGDATLETGEGVSTVLFALLGARHTCVTPNDGAVARIRAYCADRGVPLDAVTFAMGLSEDVLPALGDSALDVVLVDGSHSLPAPFIDWYYAGRRLRVGGVVVVDDVQLWPCGLLADFLASEPMWREVFAEPGRTRAFERVRGGELIRHWQLQPMVVAETERRAPGTWRATGAKAGRAVGMLRAGDYRTFAARVAKTLRVR